MRPAGCDGRRHAAVGGCSCCRSRCRCCPRGRCTRCRSRRSTTTWPSRSRGRSRSRSSPASTTALPPAQRRVTTILAGNYGEAGAIDRYGAGDGLPAAYSGANNFWLWGPPPAAGHVGDRGERRSGTAAARVPPRQARRDVLERARRQRRRGRRADLPRDRAAVLVGEGVAGVPRLRLSGLRPCLRNGDLAGWADGIRNHAPDAYRRARRGRAVRRGQLARRADRVRHRGRRGVHPDRIAADRDRRLHGYRHRHHHNAASRAGVVRDRRRRRQGARRERQPPCQRRGHLPGHVPGGRGGDNARAVLPDAVRKSHERLCTVGRTVELPTPITTRIE